MSNLRNAATVYAMANPLHDWRLWFARTRCFRWTLCWLGRCRLGGRDVVLAGTWFTGTAGVPPAFGSLRTSSKERVAINRPAFGTLRISGNESRCDELPLQRDAWSASRCRDRFAVSKTLHATLTCTRSRTVPHKLAQTLHYHFVVPL